MPAAMDPLPIPAIDFFNTANWSPSAPNALFNGLYKPNLVPFLFKIKFYLKIF